jgi:hypothetical protein
VNLKSATVFSSQSLCLVNADDELCAFRAYLPFAVYVIGRSQDLSVVQAGLDGSVRFLVTVTTESGEPVPDLRKRDFTVFDGETIRLIGSFRVLTAPTAQYSDSQISRATLGMPNKTSAAPVYEVIFDGARPRGSRQFHEVGIAVDRPNLKITTSAGYLTRRY